MSEAKAVVLLSGGLDSTTTLALAKSQGFRCYCLSFLYGQRQAIELSHAQETARSMGCEKHLILRLELDKIGGSALTGNENIPKKRSFTEMEKGVPLTYVPGRNTIFLAHAVAWAEVLGAFDIFIGVNVLDYSGYPDCRPEFLRSFEKTANFGTKAGSETGRSFTIHAPLLSLNKSEIIQTGMKLGVDFSKTHSCYDPDIKGRACGECDACLLRLKGFSEAGIADPATYIFREDRLI